MVDMGISLNIMKYPSPKCYIVRRMHRFIICLNDVSVGFVIPPPLLRQCIAIFAVAEGWLLLDIG